MAQAQAVMVETAQMVRAVALVLQGIHLAKQVVLVEQVQEQEQVELAVTTVVAVVQVLMVVLVLAVTFLSDGTNPTLRLIILANRVTGQPQQA